ncbi:MAG TPA: Dabb family protein [Verrucomicrobiae bacterium]
MEISLASPDITAKTPQMFSHVVFFWTDPDKPEAADAVIAAGNKFLKSIPGSTHFHIGKMAGSHRPVVDQSYQVGLNIGFTSKQAQDDYQAHPQHLEFVEQCMKSLVKKVLVYDFE